jgi:hypothetical protein
MLEWFEGLAGPQFATAVLWTFAALILLVIVLVIIKLIRSLTFGTFVAGGRNRKTRLAVMDATAVDSHRRLVLVRRDDVEHLILIGGPTDVVVERDIRLGQPRRAALTGDGGHEAAPAPRARPPEPAPQRPANPPPARAPERPQPAAPPAARQPVREPPLPPARLPPPPRLPPATVAAPAYSSNSHAAVARQSAPPPPPARYNNNSIDDALLKELEVTFEPAAPRKPVKPVALSLDEEMTKLLGELSSQKRT